MVHNFAEMPPDPSENYFFVEETRNARTTPPLVDCPTCWQLRVSSSRLILLYRGHLGGRQTVGTYLVQTGTCLYCRMCTCGQHNDVIDFFLQR